MLTHLLSYEVRSDRRLPCSVRRSRLRLCACHDFNRCLSDVGVVGVVEQGRIDAHVHALMLRVPPEDLIHMA
jgi:hypothetical protein